MAKTIANGQQLADMLQGKRPIPEGQDIHDIIYSHVKHNLHIAQMLDAEGRSPYTSFRMPTDVPSFGIRHTESSEDVFYKKK
jgi:hypothetical protein